MRMAWTVLERDHQLAWLDPDGIGCHRGSVIKVYATVGSNIVNHTYTDSVETYGS